MSEGKKDIEQVITGVATIIKAGHHMSWEGHAGGVNLVCWSGRARRETEM